MERWELVEKGLSELPVQPWLTVGKCCVACEWNRPTQHSRCGPRERVDVVHAQTTCRLLVCVETFLVHSLFMMRQERNLSDPYIVTFFKYCFMTVQILFGYCSNTVLLWFEYCLCDCLSTAISQILFEYCLFVVLFL